MNQNNPIQTQTYKIIKKKKKKHPIIRGIIKAFFIILLLIILFAIIVGGIAAYKLYDIVKDARLSKNDLSIKYENSVVKDIDGNVIATLNGEENRQSISIDNMSKYLPTAFVAIEDERFYEHKGVDAKRTLAATYTYIKNKGQSPFGGSTITQQLIKNLTQEKEDTWQRKVREMARAYYVEQEMSKEEILELYLNLIFLGDTVYGVQQGSNYYFDKNASDLTLAESAFLAGINHSPNSYNPFISNNKELLEKIKTRTKVVIDKMYQLGNITGEEYNTANKEIELGLNFNQGAFVQNVFSYHTDAAINQIISELQEKHSWTYEQAKLYLYSGGFTIYTTENPTMQATMEEEFNDGKFYKTAIDVNGELQESQAAMVIIDHKTGYVLATVGGLREKTTSFGFNRATDGKKQTGSSMKTIAVLAPTIDQGIITASTIFDDNPTTFTYNNQEFKPKNYNYYRGLITTREAIASSQNIPMVKGMALLTPPKSIEFLKNAGITSIDDTRDSGLSLALGGLTYGITSLEMGGAYAAIANNGLYIEPTFYTKVVDSSGNVIIQATQRKTQIMSEAAAYVVKDILTQTVKAGGTAQICSMEGMSVAAKTGTTNNDYDRWLCGFTPYYTAAVWYGYDNSATITGWSINPASIIWSDVMRKVHIGLSIQTFSETMPENVVAVEVCKKSGFLASSTCKKYRTTYTEYFVKGTEPVQTCPYHSSAKVCTETGLLAADNCPSTKRVYGRGEYIGNNGLWKTTSSYYKVTNIPTKACTLHGGR